MAQYFNIVTNPNNPITIEDVQRICSGEGQSVQFVLEDLNNGLNGSSQLVAYTAGTQSQNQPLFTPQTINLGGQLASNHIDQRQNVYIIKTNESHVLKNTVSAQIVGENVVNIVENKGTPKVPPNNTAQGQNMQWVKMQENINYEAVLKQNTLTPVRPQYSTPMRNQHQTNVSSQVAMNSSGHRDSLEQSALTPVAKKIPIRYQNKNRQLVTNATAVTAATSSSQQLENIVNSPEDRLLDTNLSPQPRSQDIGANIVQQRQQLTVTPQQQRQQISNSPAQRQQNASNACQQRQMQMILTPQQHAQLQRQPMMMTPQQRQQHQVHISPVPQPMEVDPPENNQNNQESNNMKQQSCGSQTDNESGNRSFLYLQKTIDSPQSCIVQHQIDGNTAKMLVILHNGEQRLITFDIPNEECTVQDLLDQVNIPFGADTNVALINDSTSHINYIVEAGPGKHLYSGEGSELSDSNLSLDKVATSPDGSSPICSPSEESSNSSMTPQEKPKYVEGKLAVCPNCGISSMDFNRCQRCTRPLPEDVKAISMGIDSQAKKENMIAVNTFYKKNNDQNRTLKLEREASLTAKRGRGRGRPLTKTRLIKEPECLTISSDDEEQSEGKFKKSETENSTSIITSIAHIRHQTEMEMISEKEPVITNNSVTNVGKRNINNEGGIKGGGRESDVPNMADGSIQVPHTSLICRTVRIGSYKYIPQERIIISKSGVRFGVPLLEDDTNFVPLEVKFKDIVNVLIHFGRAMPVLFFYTTTNAGGMIRELLGMQDPKGPYYDPAGRDHTHKRITLLPELIEEEAKLILKTIFSPDDLLIELTSKEANDILVRASPKDSLNTSSMTKRPGQTTSTTNNTANGGIQTIMVYPPPPAKGGIAINTEDYACLGEDQFLNDVIIDFYLKYLTLEVLSEEDQNRTHVFSSYFYKRLTSPHAPAADTATPLSPAAKRHARVQKWTKNVNIFEKDFIVIPINEHAHWFLAIICFPGFVGKVRVAPTPTKESDVKKIVHKSKKAKELKLQAVTIGNTTITPVTATITLDPGDEGSERDEAEGDDDELEMDSDDDEETEDGDAASKKAPKPPPPNSALEKIERFPCILIFDSLAGASRSRVVATLRDYLSCEYLAKMGTEKVFSKDTIKGACPKVPQQTNFTDCGVYVLQYVESFFSDPITNYMPPIKTLKQWFEEIVVTRKREELSKLLVRLMNATKGDRNILLPVLTFPTQEGKLLQKPESTIEMKSAKSEAASQKKGNAETDSRSSSGTASSGDNAETSIESSNRSGTQQVLANNSTISSSSSNENSQTEMSVDGKIGNRSSSDTMSYLKAKRIPRLMSRTSESLDDKQQAKKHKWESFDSCK
ncbi:uncharacterized protein LOC105688968 isoform X2 [Athalia rosae]|uniref:uncharacterized protein LOC105688968 isoform X2 n=1 Tax=Athalia rosae TaxID=37344 RepID=UPI0020332074|nr:uncharacterized protein LOC105688968 isoform X2 [Athalia rosae]